MKLIQKLEDSNELKMDDIIVIYNAEKHTIFSGIISRVPFWILQRRVKEFKVDTLPSDAPIVYATVYAYAGKEASE